MTICNVPKSAAGHKRQEEAAGESDRPAGFGIIKEFEILGILGLLPRVEVKDSQEFGKPGRREQNLTSKVAN